MFKRLFGSKKDSAEKYAPQTPLDSVDRVVPNDYTTEIRLDPTGRVERVPYSLNITAPYTSSLSNCWSMPDVLSAIERVLTEHPAKRAKILYGTVKEGADTGYTEEDLVSIKGLVEKLCPESSELVREDGEQWKPYPSGICTF